MTTSGLPAIDVPQNGTPTAAPPGAVRSRPATTRKTAGKAAVVGAPFRFLTANIQSFPEDALTLEQALSDLRLNASDGDLVLLQEIATRYRPLVREAFPDPEWEVFFGTSDNSEPIAFRTAAFGMVAGDTTLLHPAHARLHGRRHITHVQLRDRSTGLEFHVTNLHLVAGAFNNVVEPDQALRLQEWDEGIAKHRLMLEALVAGGLPVIGGGDYNRQLRKHKSLGTDIAGSPVRYVVDPGSIDLLWVIDGREAAWSVRGRKVYGSRTSKDPVRNSDHAAREATVMLTTRAKATVPTPVPSPHPTVAAPQPAVHLPGPFELTTFGDGTPKKVDWKTRAALQEAEARLGYPLTIVQGSYNAGGVSASAGTHDGGGVVDLLPWDWQRKVHVLRSIGFAAWHRPTIAGLWGEHIHAVMVDHGRLAPSAAQQVVAYRAGRDGLRSNLPDPFWHPAPIPVFSYPPALPDAGHAAGHGTGHDAGPDAGTAIAGRAPAHPSVPPLGPPFPPRRTLDGVDTSHYQSGGVDLRAARHAGVRWWYVKATEGTGFVDPTYQRRVQAARKAGIPVGAYHFARPEDGDAAEEARYFLSHTDIRPGDMLPMLDLESAEGLSMAELTTWTGTWVRTVTRELAAGGAVGRPIIYTRFNLGNGFGCLLWVARYSDDFRAPVIPRPWKRAVIWQHSDGRFGPVKHVPGFGAVDANAMHPDVPLSALRLRSASSVASPGMPAGTAARTSVRPRRRGRPPTSGDGDQLRADLLTAAAKLQAAIESLPKG